MRTSARVSPWWLIVGVLVLLALPRFGAARRDTRPTPTLPPTSTPAGTQPVVATPIDTFSPYEATVLLRVTVFQDLTVAEHAAGRTAISAINPDQVKDLIAKAWAADAAWWLESGSKVRILEHQVVKWDFGTGEDGWAKVQSPDGKTGWVLEDELLKMP